MTRSAASESSSSGGATQTKAHARRRRIRSGGRPSRAASAELGDRILDVATDLFLTLGFGATSIEAVAQRAGISKRTFYHRFADKSALFSAVVHRIVDRLRPPVGVPLIEGAGLTQILERLAGIILDAALTPQALALHRLIIAESGRFPDLAGVVHRAAAAYEAIRLIAGALEREARSRKVALRNPAFSAELFLHMVLTVPQRRAMGLGTPMGPAELRKWSHDVVRLFLNGCGLPTTRRR